ncbi:MAG TPA: phage tail tape measure protein [bacterium]|nr:phage tail tape measure protein [bacterium]
MADYKLSFVIDAENKAQKTINEVKSQLDGIQKTAKDFEPAFKKMAVVGTAAFASITAVVVSTTKEFADSEKQLKIVDTIIEGLSTTTLNNFSGGLLSTQEAIEQLKQKTREFGSELQAMGGISDETASVGLAKLIQITGDFTEAQKAAMLAADLSIYRQIDYSSAVDIVGKVLSGNLGILSRYGIQLKENATVEEAMIELTRRAGGQYQAYGNTLEGQITILKASISDLKEAIGGVFADIEKSIVSALIPFIQNLTKWIDENKELVKWITIIGGALSGIIAVIGTLGLTFIAITKTIKELEIAFIALKGIGLATIGWIGLLVAAVAGSIYMLVKYRDEIMVNILYFKNWINSIEEAIGKFLRLESVVNRAKQKTAENNVVIEEYKNKIEAGKNKTDEFSGSQIDLSGAISNTTDNITKMGAETERVMGISKDKFNEVINTIKELQDKTNSLFEDLEKIDKDYKKQSFDEELSYRSSIAELVAKTELEKEELIKKKEDKIKELEIERERLVRERQSKIRNEASAKEIDRVERDIEDIDFMMEQKNNKEIIDLVKQIEEKNAILKTYKDMEINVESSIQEYKDYMRMNELQKLEYDYQRKSMMRQVEMLTEKANKLQEIIDAKQQYEALMVIFGQEQQGFILKEIEKTKSFKENLETQYKILGNWKDAVVQVYSDMVKEANAEMAKLNVPVGGKSVSEKVEKESQKSVSAYKALGLKNPIEKIIGYQEGTNYVPRTGLYMLHQGEAVIPTKNNSGIGGIVVNVNGGYYLSEKAAEEMGNLIVKKLKENIKL